MGNIDPMDVVPSPFSFDNSYARNLEGFYVPWMPLAVPGPELILLNTRLAASLGLDQRKLTSPEGIDMLAGNRLPSGAEPIAQAYAGHQFGQFSPQLGDGRALLLGEIVDADGHRFDLALKGSGPTPFSRRGDGKYALGPALREYLVGEAMAALGVPTSRALAVVATGEMIRRGRPVPGAVLTRIASSHLRIGTFEFLAAHRGPDAVRKLADYAIRRHDPEVLQTDRPYLEFLRRVSARQASLVADWLGLGFIHGVMNTDNMAISGETIDYGPCAFMEAYHPGTVFSSIDTAGRYAYGRQASIAQWNLARLAETLVPLIASDREEALAAATAVIEEFPQRHAACWSSVMRKKLGLDDQGGDESDDRQLAEDFLSLLQQEQADFTNAFRMLERLASGEAGIQDAWSKHTGFMDWLRRWKIRQPQRPDDLLQVMKRANPCYIPRNHLVEAALDAAVDRGDMAPFTRLLAVLERPFACRPEDAGFTEPASAGFNAGFQTFCGT